MSKRLGVTLPNSSADQLQALQERLDMTQIQVLIMAIDRLARTDLDRAPTPYQVFTPYLGQASWTNDIATLSGSPANLAHAFARDIIETLDRLPEHPHLVWKEAGEYHRKTFSANSTTMMGLPVPRYLLDIIQNDSENYPPERFDR